MESIVLQVHNKIWHCDHYLSSRNLVEGFKFLVILILEKVHPDFISLSAHIFFSFEDSYSHAAHRNWKATLIVVVARHPLAIDAIVSETHVGCWEEAVEELVICHCTVKI
jgi:hypothetical protein